MQASMDSCHSVIARWTVAIGTWGFIICEREDEVEFDSMIKTYNDET